MMAQRSGRFHHRSAVRYPNCETGDYRPFNSRGATSTVRLKDGDLNTVTIDANQKLPLLGVVDQIVIRKIDLVRQQPGSSCDTT
jgi:hypothetical protein